MINIKSPHEIECMRKAGAILRDCLLFLGDRVKPGVSTKRLDEFATIISKGTIRLRPSSDTADSPERFARLSTKLSFTDSPPKDDSKKAR